MSVSETNGNGNCLIGDDIAIRHLSSQLANAREAIREHKAENEALDAAHERLKAAATCVVGSGKVYPLEIKYREAWHAVPSYLLGDLERAVTGEAKDGDVIEVEFEERAASEIIRGQSDRIRELEAELAHAKDFAKTTHSETLRFGESNARLMKENEQLKAEVEELQAENCELVDRATPPKGGHAPCLFAYRRLADAARQLIWANRRGELAASHVNVLDFALDGVAEQEGEGVSCGQPCGQPCSSAVEPESSEFTRLAREACEGWVNPKVRQHEFEERMNRLAEAAK